MPKDDNIKLSKDEGKILEELIKDSRQTPHEIAQKLGFSRQKVWRTINRLEKNKTIWGYTTVVNQISRGYNYYFALCKAKAPIFDTIDQLINTIKEKKADKLNVRFLGQFYLHGTYDWLIIFLAKDILICNRASRQRSDQYFIYAAGIHIHYFETQAFPFELVSSVWDFS